MQTPWLLLLGSLRERLKGDSDRRADGEATVVATDFVSSNEEARESWREGKEKKRANRNCWNSLDLYFLALLGNKIFFPRKFRKISRKLIRINFRKD